MNDKTRTKIAKTTYALGVLGGFVTGFVTGSLPLIDHVDQYFEQKKLQVQYKERFLEDVDFIVPYGLAMYGLTDLDEDGTFDVSEYIGVSPGAYSHTTKESMYKPARGTVPDEFFVMEDSDFELAIDRLLDSYGN